MLVLLIGHGTALDGDDGKFNLVGPDLSGEEWASLVKPIAGRLVFVNTTGGSFPFLHKIAGPGRIVLTATESAAQQFETVFPEFFVKAFEDAGSRRRQEPEGVDLGGVHVRERPRQDLVRGTGQLATERPLLDDTGRGIGREAGTEGADGALARTTYLQPEVADSRHRRCRAGRSPETPRRARIRDRAAPGRQVQRCPPISTKPSSRSCCSSSRASTARSDRRS